MVSINRSGQKEGSLVSSKMLATKQVTSGLCEFTHAHREETLAELCVWPMVECSPSLLNARSSIPSTKQNQVKSLLYAAEEHGACTGTVPWAGEEESGKRTKRGRDAPTSRGTGLRACPATPCIRPLLAPCFLVCGVGTQVVHTAIGTSLGTHRDTEGGQEG